MKIFHTILLLPALALAVTLAPGEPLPDALHLYGGVMHLSLPPQWRLGELDSGPLKVQAGATGAEISMHVWEMPRGGHPSARAAADAWESLLFERAPYRRISVKPLLARRGTTGLLISGEVLEEDGKIARTSFAAFAAEGRYFIAETPVGGDDAIAAQMLQELAAALEFGPRQERVAAIAPDGTPVTSAAPLEPTVPGTPLPAPTPQQAAPGLTLPPPSALPTTPEAPAAGPRPATAGETRPDPRHQPTASAPPGAAVQPAPPAPLPSGTPVTPVSPSGAPRPEVVAATVAPPEAETVAVLPPPATSAGAPGAAASTTRPQPATLPRPEAPGELHVAAPGAGWPRQEPPATAPVAGPVATPGPAASPAAPLAPSATAHQTPGVQPTLPSPAASTGMPAFPSVGSRPPTPVGTTSPRQEPLPPGPIIAGPQPQLPTPPAAAGPVAPGAPATAHQAVLPVGPPAAPAPVPGALTPPATTTTAPGAPPAPPPVLQDVTAAAPPAPAPGTILHSSPLGFSLQHPADWRVQLVDGHIEVVSPTDAGASAPSAGVIIWPVSQLTVGQDPVALARALLQESPLVGASAANLRARISGETTILAGETSPPQAGRRVVAACYVQKDQGLLTALLARPEEYEERLPALLRVLDSFHGGPWWADVPDVQPKLVMWREPELGRISLPAPEGWRVEGELRRAGDIWGIEVQMESTDSRRLRCLWRQPILPVNRDLTPVLRNLGWQEGDRYPANSPDNHLRVAARLAPQDFLTRSWLRQGPDQLEEVVVDRLTASQSVGGLAGDAGMAGVVASLHGQYGGQQRQRLCMVATADSVLAGEPNCWQAAILEAEAPVGAISEAVGVLHTALDNAVLGPDAPGQVRQLLAAAREAVRAAAPAPNGTVAHADVLAVRSDQARGRLWLLPPAGLEPWQQALTAIMRKQAPATAMAELGADYWK